jgi:hypothetical protein
MWRNGSLTKLRVRVLLFEFASPLHGEKHVRRARLLRHTLVFFVPRLPPLRTICIKGPADPTALEMYKKRCQLELERWEGIRGARLWAVWAMEWK